MDIRRLHDFDLTLAAAVAVQRRLAARVSRAPAPGPWRFIAGADVSSARGDDRLFAAAVVWDRRTARVVETAEAVRRARFPYVPGLLSFCEGPAVLAALARLRHRVDAVLFDGQGYAHPRRLGLASHLGLFLAVPTVGCAKSRLVGEPRRVLGARRGARATLYDRGEAVGALLCTRDGVAPLYLSVGHGLSLDQAVRLVLGCHEGLRLPAPTGRADQRTKALRRAAAGASASPCNPLPIETRPLSFRAERSEARNLNPTRREISPSFRRRKSAPAVGRNDKSARSPVTHFMTDHPGGGVAGSIR